MHVPLHNNVLNPNNNRQQPFVPLTQEQRAKIVHLDEDKFVIGDIQRNIALNMIADFLMDFNMPDLMILIMHFFGSNIIYCHFKQILLREQHCINDRIQIRLLF